MIKLHLDLWNCIHARMKITNHDSISGAWCDGKMYNYRVDVLIVERNPIKIKFE